MTVEADMHRFALLGDPVKHSLSPVMHRAAFEANGLKGEYTVRQCNESEFIESIAELRTGLWSGFNVTMPHKHLAMAMCDTTTELAGLAMSVNTLKLDAGAVAGESTDARAFARLFGDSEFRNRPILILGAGGSASAALAAAPGAFVSARDPDASTKLAARFATTGAAPVPFGEAVQGAVVVNATPLGMNGEVLPDDVLRSAGALIDLPYGGGRTPAVREAMGRSIPVCDGIRFLALQAAASFEWWTGIGTDPAIMDQAARNA